MTKGKNFPVRLEQARLVSSLLWHSVSRQLLKTEAYDHFHGNSLYGNIPTMKELIRMLTFVSRSPTCTLPYNRI